MHKQFRFIKTGLKVCLKQWREFCLTSLVTICLFGISLFLSINIDGASEPRRILILICLTFLIILTPAMFIYNGVILIKSTKLEKENRDWLQNSGLKLLLGTSLLILSFYFISLFWLMIFYTVVSPFVIASMWTGFGAAGVLSLMFPMICGLLLLFWIIGQIMLVIFSIKFGVIYFLEGNRIIKIINILFKNPNDYWENYLVWVMFFLANSIALGYMFYVETHFLLILFGLFSIYLIYLFVFLHESLEYAKFNGGN